MAIGSRVSDDNPDGETPSRVEVEAQHARIVGSDSFQGAQRSTTFLDFIVAETLDGRQHRITGYIIGVEAFGRGDDFDAQADPIVRVEAGRLRRRLERYYLAEGTEDPILIEVPKGAYTPTFTYRSAAIAETDESTAAPGPVPVGDDRTATAGPRRGLWLAAGLGAVAVLLVFLGLRAPAGPETASVSPDVDPEVLALYEQAMELRDPPLDPLLRWKLAEEAYRQVIELDPNFAGGYAGLAFVLSTRSWWGLSDDAEGDALAALDAATEAVTKDPEFAWGQIGLAFAHNLQGDFAESASAAALGAELGPDDPYALSFSGLLRTFAGEIDPAVPLVERAIRIDPLSFRTPFRNLAGVVLFHAGRYQEALDVLTENRDLGGPDGPHMAWYRAATLARLGRPDEARAEIERARSMPFEIPPERFVRAFEDPAEADELLEALYSVGYPR